MSDTSTREDNRDHGGDVPNSVESRLCDITATLEEIQSELKAALILLRDADGVRFDTDDAHALLDRAEDRIREIGAWVTNHQEVVG